MDPITPSKNSKSNLKNDEILKKKLTIKDLRRRFKCKDHIIDFFQQKGNYNIY
jgi:hypothetical protein